LPILLLLCSTLLLLLRLLRLVNNLVLTNVITSGSIPSSLEGIPVIIVRSVAHSIHNLVPVWWKG
jgi:hypothetical protein